MNPANRLAPPLSILSGCLLSVCLLLSAGAACAQEASVPPPRTFSQAVQQVVSRPLYKHAIFGIEVYSLDSGKILFSLNGETLFTPASTTKLLTEGTALHYLGADYLFHTFIYRTGKIDRSGTLKGDLVLVASGDPNLSNRVQPDGTLAFMNHDHSYGGQQARLVPGDPLQVLRRFAGQIAAAGVKRVQGNVWVDTSMFPEGARESGTGTVVSPIAVNDNLIDVAVSPGATVGSAADLKFSLHVPYIHFDNKIVTGTAGSRLSVSNETTVAPDGTKTVTYKGSIPLGASADFHNYAVSSPSRFTEALLKEALADDGITVEGKGDSKKPDFNKIKHFYNAKYQVAEHASPPLSQEVKVTLKVSQNLHANMMPFVLGAVVGKATQKIDQKGLALERSFLEKGGLDLDGASQSDGAGVVRAAFFTPDFMVHYLAYMTRQPDFPTFKHALPILGRDGTLSRTQVHSAAAGHVFAKTGGYSNFDMLNMRNMLLGKGLAGYTTTPAGEHLTFAIYVNHVALPDVPDAAQTIVGEALGEIAAAAYELPIHSGTIQDVTPD
ncbi:MAG: D-alanyl-D-alanine carboxypeptidase/D-alanyl-D-alanine-endopeptidase [Acidobacteriaceae bacterium]